MSLLQCEIELEECGGDRKDTKAYKVSMTALIVALVLVMVSFALVLPVPIGFVVLYIFREFEGIAVKAIYIKNIMSLLIVVMFSFELLFVF